MRERRFLELVRDRSRLRARVALHGIGRDLDEILSVRRTVMRHPLLGVAGAAVGGVVLGASAGGSGRLASVAVRYGRRLALQRLIAALTLQ